MTYKEAFVHLRARVMELQKIPVSAQAYSERTEENALLIALHAMRDWSGSFPPDEMIRAVVPTSRLAID